MCFTLVLPALPQGHPATPRRAPVPQLPPTPLGHGPLGHVLPRKQLPGKRSEQPNAAAGSRRQHGCAYVPLVGTSVIHSPGPSLVLCCLRPGTRTLPPGDSQARKVACREPIQQAAYRIQQVHTQRPGEGGDTTPL